MKLPAIRAVPTVTRQRVHAETAPAVTTSAAAPAIRKNRAARVALTATRPPESARAAPAVTTSATDLVSRKNLAVRIVPAAIRKRVNARHVRAGIRWEATVRSVPDYHVMPDITSAETVVKPAPPDIPRVVP